MACEITGFKQETVKDQLTSIERAVSVMVALTSIKRAVLVMVGSILPRCKKITSCGGRNVDRSKATGSKIRV